MQNVQIRVLTMAAPTTDETLPVNIRITVAVSGDYKAGYKAVLSLGGSSGRIEDLCWPGWAVSNFLTVTACENRQAGRGN